jgi:hypothetical protein
LTHIRYKKRIVGMKIMVRISQYTLEIHMYYYMYQFCIINHIHLPKRGFHEYNSQVILYTRDIGAKFTKEPSIVSLESTLF